MSSTVLGFLDGLRPTKRLRPSEWADEHRFLSSVAAAEPGRWRTSRTPYLKEIMDCFDPYSQVQEVIFMKGAQIGATECGYNILGYYIDLDPCPIMCVMPTEGTAKRNSKMRIDPMIEASPTLKGKIAAIKSRDKGNTILQKDFAGGTLMLAGANSASSLRSVPVRVLILDEVDAFPQDLEGEGSPVGLAKARTRTFANRKIAQISTPTVESTSAVHREFFTTDQRYFHVPCPHCAAMQRLRWEQVRFSKTANPVVSAHYECEHCSEAIEERHKPWMLKHGQWMADAPELADPKRIGYHLSSLYSPLGWYSWADAANDFLAAKRKNDQNKMKVFVNTVLGEVWKEKVIVPPYERLYERRGGYQTKQVPAEVCVLTAGVDVQADRLEMEITGWGEGLRSWVVDYRVLTGDTSATEVWDKLREVLYEGFQRTDGARLGVYKMAVDSGYNTNHVYKFCRQEGAARVVPVKGQAGSRQRIMLSSPQSVDVRSNGKRVGKTMLWNLGVDLIKTEVYAALNLNVNDEGEDPPYYCRFPSNLDISYFRMLTAERLVKRKNPKGYEEHIWEKTQDRNEALDCRVYSRAAAAIVGLDRWEAANWKAAGATAYAPPTQKNEVSKPHKAKEAQRETRRKRKNSFW